MSRKFLIAASAAALFLAASDSALAQSASGATATTGSATTVTATTAQPLAIAAGAAGEMPFTKYVWEKTIAWLGFGPADRTVPAPTRTASPGND